MKWRRNIPTKPGWYFWRRSITTKNPKKFKLYYIDPENTDPCEEYVVRGGLWKGPIEITTKSQWIFIKDNYADGWHLWKSRINITNEKQFKPFYIETHKHYFSIKEIFNNEGEECSWPDGGRFFHIPKYFYKT